MLKRHAKRLAEFNRESVLNLCLDQVVIRRRGSLGILKGQLINEDGSRIYDDPKDQRVVYSSTLVDVAANRYNLLYTNPQLQDSDNLLDIRGMRPNFLPGATLATP